MKRGNVFRDPKFIILAGLIVLLVVVNVRQWSPSGLHQPQGHEKSTQRAKGSTEHDPILLADQLKDPRMEFRQEQRNIFSFLQQAPQPAAGTQAANTAPPPPQAVCGNNACEPGEDSTNCPTDCQPPPPPPPVINLRYIGYIGYLSQSDGSVAFLTDGKEVYMARENDVVANLYRVVKITEDTVQLALLNNNQSSTIRFQGNQGG